MKEYLGVLGIGAMFFLTTSAAWGASGQVTAVATGINDDGYACGDVIVVVDWVVTEDDSPNEYGGDPGCPYPENGLDLIVPAWGSYIDSSSTFAKLVTIVDGQTMGSAPYKTSSGIGEVKTGGWQGFWADYEPGSSHVVKFELVDVYGVQCHMGSYYLDPGWRENGAITSDEVSFKICGSDDPCCCNPDPCCPEDVCCLDPEPGSDHASAGNGN